jgi:actin-related protein 6
MNNERITVPELLFTPSDIGLNQSGISETIVQSLSAMKSYEQSILYDTVLLVGGNTLFENYQARIAHELRHLTPDIHNVTIYQPKKYVHCSY